MTKLLRILALLIMVLCLSNCATVKGWFKKKSEEKPPDTMAQEGIQQLKKKKYDDAIDTFEKLRDRFPYSDQALLAQIKLADSYYYKKKFDEALQAYKEFEKLHPTNKAVPYAIYRQGLCYYRQRSTIDRDQTFTHKAMDEFRRLQQKFPDCEFIPQAEKYLAKCRRDLAEHDFYIASFYFRTKRYAAALDRFQALTQEYPDFPKQAEIKGYIDQCQEQLAIPPEQKTGVIYAITNIFDANW